MNPQHTYAAAGTYPVTLTVTDPANSYQHRDPSVTVRARAVASTSSNGS